MIVGLIQPSARAGRRPRVVTIDDVDDGVVDVAEARPVVEERPVVERRRITTRRTTSGGY